MQCSLKRFKFNPIPGTAGDIFMKLVRTLSDKVDPEAKLIFMTYGYDNISKSAMNLFNKPIMQAQLRYRNYHNAGRFHLSHLKEHDSAFEASGEIEIADTLKNTVLQNTVEGGVWYTVSSTGYGNIDFNLFGKTADGSLVILVSSLQASNNYYTPDFFYQRKFDVDDGGHWWDTSFVSNFDLLRKNKKEHAKSVLADRVFVSITLPLGNEDGDFQDTPEDETMIRAYAKQILLRKEDIISKALKFEDTERVGILHLDTETHRIQCKKGTKHLKMRSSHYSNPSSLNSIKLDDGLENLVTHIYPEDITEDNLVIAIKNELYRKADQAVIRIVLEDIVEHTPESRKTLDDNLRAMSVVVKLTKENE